MYLRERDPCGHTRSVDNQHGGRLLQNELKTLDQRMKGGEHGREIGLAHLTTAWDGAR